MNLLREPEPRYARHRLNVAEYHRMAEVGLLAADARVELIEGEIVDMAPMGTRHHAALTRLTRQLVPAAGERVTVTIQQPLRLGPHNEPEPDFALLKPRPDDYASALPTAADCLLVIEVSDTTLDYDLRVKGPLYARHGVPEYWVLDLQAQTLHRHTRPQAEGWLEITALKNPGRMALPGLEGATVDLAKVLGA